MDIEHFQMLSTVKEVSVEDGILKSEAIIPEKSAIFDGHFPGHPILPGVLLVEIMAQSSGYLAMEMTDFKGIAILAKISNSKFYEFVLPGDRLLCTTTLIRSGTGFTFNKVVVTREGKKMASADLRMKLVAFPSIQAQQLIIGNYQLLTGGRPLMAEVS